MKPEAQPRHRQDSQQHKDALGRTAPKGGWPGLASPLRGVTGSRPDADKADTPTRNESAPAKPCGAVLEA
jgi:hypothetical protein